ncbi:MAG: endoglucanase [Prevotella sp.]|nr:endoglucanase [Prevotella sp.]
MRTITQKKTWAVILTVLATFATLSTQAADVKTFPANDNGITYTGRVAINADGSVSYDWTGVYFQTDFTGGYFAIEASEAGTSWHNLFIDGKWVRKLQITGNNPQRIVLAEKLGKGVHRLRLQKCTEGQYGCTTIHQVVTAKGATLQAVESKQRMIEVYGDSYTCGYGTESSKANDPFRLETENCDKAYGCIIARYFDADYALTAHSGQGMVRNWADGKQISDINMSTRYTRVFDDHGTQPYLFNRYQPQLVIINLGTNDFSPVAIPTDEQYTNAYLKMIETIKNKYQGVKIFCVTPHSASRYLQASLQLLKERVASIPDVHMANPLTDMVTVEHDMGADWHPNYQGQRKIAMSLIPQISAIMGWSLTDKVVE